MMSGAWAGSIVLYSVTLMLLLMFKNVANLKNLAGLLLYHERGCYQVTSRILSLCHRSLPHSLVGRMTQHLEGIAEVSTLKYT